MIVRFDDISPNTNIYKMNYLIKVLEDAIPDLEIWLAVNMFSKSSTVNSVYPDVPFKDKPKDYFYNVDRTFLPHIFNRKLVSHGLIHCDHSRIGIDAQEMSIVSSCKYLETDVFVPPFNRWNEATELVCKENGIKLQKISDGWLSMEHNDFNPKHDKWYLHPWKWTPEELGDYLASKKLGQLSGDAVCGSTRD